MNYLNSLCDFTANLQKINLYYQDGDLKLDILAFITLIII